MLCTILKHSKKNPKTSNYPEESFPVVFLNKTCIIHNSKKDQTPLVVPEVFTVPSFDIFWGSLTNIPESPYVMSLIRSALSILDLWQRKN